VSKEQKDIFKIMQENKLFDYGNIIKQSEIHDIFSIKVPDVGTFKDFQDVQLLELGCIGFIREQLIKEGKYIKKEGTNYRVLLPSENAKQADEMYNQAKRKYTRADKLISCMPKELRENKASVSHSSQAAIFRTQRHSQLIA